jgi:hypothetical protein
MVRFPALALALRWSLVDNFQGVALARAHPRGAQKRAQGTNVAPLPADDLTHVTFRDFKFDHVVVEMVNENLIGSVDHPFRNLLDESAHISRFSHEICLCCRSCRGDRRLRVKLAHPL